jgi:hypothetical protein
MSNENDDNDRLSIPLEGALKRVQEESGLFRSNVGILLFLLLMFPLVISKNIPPLGSALVLIVAGFMIYQAWGKCRYAKKLLKLYDGRNIPAFILDSAGLTCPIILIDYLSKAPEYLMNSGQSALCIKWSDIEKWTITPRSQRILSGLYLLELRKESAVPELTGITIKRDFPIEKEREIVNFAQRFLPSPIGLFPTARQDKPSDKMRWKWIAVAVCFFVVLLVMKVLRA